MISGKKNLPQIPVISAEILGLVGVRIFCVNQRDQREKKLPQIPVNSAEISGLIGVRIFCVNQRDQREKNLPQVHGPYQEIILAPFSELTKPSPPQSYGLLLWDESHPQGSVLFRHPPYRAKKESA